MTPGRSARGDAQAIFRAGLSRVDPVPMILEAITADGDILRVRTELESLDIDLGIFDRIVAFGAGKASARMALGLEAALGDRLSGGLVVVKAGHAESLSRIRLAEASHPVPDGSSVDAARALLALGKDADERTLAIGLTSGGGSALLCAPAISPEPGRSPNLVDKRETTRLLLACGAGIREVNCVRKHLSAIKGGRLAAAFFPATVLNLILSDVIGDDPGSIASGITAPDPTTYADALHVLARHAILDLVPDRVRTLLEAGAAGDVPDSPKPGDPVFSRTRNVIIGSNHQAVLAARSCAESLGYACLALTSGLEGEAREAAGFLAAIGEDIREREMPLRAPACVICGGETTVKLRGSGKGGRNQELALAFLARFEDEPERIDGLCLLSAGTDGNDGPTDAAGAFACREALDKAAEAGMSARAYLDRNDSYDYFDRIGFHLKTGPTNTNVCDLQILVVRESPR
ncbi:MAG: DUF4147 domain-containing protein [Spirochaetes bacterium]|nr:DUF4147 domain-containing protein [Spirochaetota bacterium]